MKEKMERNKLKIMEATTKEPPQKEEKSVKERKKNWKNDERKRMEKTVREKIIK